MLLCRLAGGPELSPYELANGAVDLLETELRNLRESIERRPRVVAVTSLGCMDGSCNVYQLTPRFSPDDDEALAPGEEDVVIDKQERGREQVRLR